MLPTFSLADVSRQLLEWLEEAFKYAETEEEAGRGDSRSRNPMISLFYGQYKTEGVRDGTRTGGAGGALTGWWCW